MCRIPGLQDLAEAISRIQEKKTRTCSRAKGFKGFSRIPGFPGPLATLEVLRCFQLYANLGSKFKSNLKYILNIYHVMKSVWSVLITQSQVTRASAAYVASIFINSSFMFTLTSSEIWGQQYCKNFEIQKFLQVFLTNFYVI